MHVSQEVMVDGDRPLRCFTFSNYYVAQLSIRQMMPRSNSSASRGAWRTVLSRHTLMQRPHEEGEAELQHAITVQQVRHELTHHG